MFVRDGAGLGVMFDDRHLQHDSAVRIDRQKRRISLRPFLAERRQHHFHHLFEMVQHFEQCIVETSRRVTGGRGHKFVIEAKLIEEYAQPRIVVLGKAVVCAERVWHAGKRLAEMLCDQLFVWNVVRNLAQSVHVVGKRDQLRFDLVLSEHAKRMAHHRGARHFAECTDMRQARGSIAGFENDLVLGPPLEPRHDLAGFFEWPGVGKLGHFAERGGGGFDRGHDALRIRGAYELRNRDTSAANPKFAQASGAL